MPADKDTLIANACDMLDELINRYAFDQVLNGSIDDRDWERSLAEYPAHIAWAAGATRFVFWNPDDCSVVYKIDKPGYDMCHREAFVYQCACEAHLEKFFAKTEYLFDYVATLVDNFSEEEYHKEIGVYVCDFCDISEDNNSDEAYTLMRKDFCEDHDIEPDYMTNEQESDFQYELGDDDYNEAGMFRIATEHWGARDSIRVKDFIHFMSVNDLHCGNWGWRNGAWVIIDYAGYHCTINRDPLPEYFLKQGA